MNFFSNFHVKFIEVVYIWVFDFERNAIYQIWLKRIGIQTMVVRVPVIENILTFVNPQNEVSTYALFSKPYMLGNHSAHIQSTVFGISFCCS